MLYFSMLCSQPMPRKANAIPGGAMLPLERMKNAKATAAPRGGHENPQGKSAYKLKTQDGYKTTEEIRSGAAQAFRPPTGDYEYPVEMLQAASGTSIFDPVLTELSYRWFCPPGGVILDPFAGGSVRGIVASKLGFRYYGNDLSERQITANRIQGEKICAGDPHPPVWTNGDSQDIERLQAGVEADMVFSCPPYFDLEVYSNAEQDLSAMGYEEFRIIYNKIIAASVRMLKQDRFICWVVGDVRDKDGIYRNFPGHTIQAFEDAGARLYNEAVLVTAVGSLPVRTTKTFEASRKLGKTHQNYYTFVKGDPRRATQAIGNDHA